MTRELYHRPRVFVERAPRPGRRVEGPRTEADREDVRNGAELLHFVLGEGRRPAPEEEASAGLADPQEEAGLEAPFDLLRVLGLPGVDAGDLAQPGALRLGPSYEGLVVFAFLMGFGYGGWVALSPSVAADLFGPEGLSGTLGALYTSAAIGALLGPPAAGFVKDATGTYRPAIAAAMVLAVASLLVILPLRPPGRK